MIDADLISRKAAVSRISDLIVLELRCACIPTWNEVYKALNDLPTLDAVPVIRCTKCKYYGPGDHAGFWRCENWGVDINRQASPPETFYCADGETKEEEHETDLSAPDSCDMALVIAHASDIPIHTERIWMETRAGELWPVQYRYWDGDLLHFLDKYSPIADAVFDAGQYLTTWRCWTAKPTNEQREAVKWDEKPGEGYQ